MPPCRTASSRARIRKSHVISFLEGTQGLIERLTEQEGKKGAGYARYFASHPPVAERLGTLTALAAKAPGPPVKLLPDYDWDDIKKMCGDARTRSPRGRATPREESR
jgi:predicted Zn-dependent protease